MQQQLDFLKARAGAAPSVTAGMMALLGQNLLQQKKYADAEKTLRECLTVREKLEPDVWTTFDTRSLLGEALAGQKQYAEAEPLLKAGYEGMKQRADTIPPPFKLVRLTEALERLVRLYEAWDKPDEAAKWRQELEQAKKAAAQETPKK